MPDPLLTPTELAELIKKPARTLSQWRYLKRGPSYIRLEGGDVRYRLSAVESWLNAQTVA